MERKLPWVAGAMGAANSGLLGVQDYVASREYARQNTDYDRFLAYMSSADATRAANPNAYAAGDAAATALSLAMAGKNIYKAGVRQFGDDAINMIGGKGQFQRVAEKGVEEGLKWAWGEGTANVVEYDTTRRYYNDEK